MIIGEEDIIYDVRVLNRENMKLKYKEMFIIVINLRNIVEWFEFFLYLLSNRIFLKSNVSCWWGWV